LYSALNYPLEMIQWLLCVGFLPHKGVQVVRQIIKEVYAMYRCAATYIYVIYLLVQAYKHARTHWVNHKKIVNNTLQ
jgi:hypothetical protein